MKIDTAIQQANIILKRNHIKSSLLDSEILISKVINKSREYIILNLGLLITVYFNRLALRPNKKDFFTAEVNDDEYKVNNLIAKVCPVKIIHINKLNN